MQEGIPRPIGQLYEAEPLVGIVPFNDGLDRRTGGRFKPLGAKARRRSETAPGRFKIVVIEATATRRAKISFSAAHLSLCGVWDARNLKCGWMIVNGFCARTV